MKEGRRSIVFGFSIGSERKLRFKKARIRTHTIVCVGSALIMVMSKYGFSDSIEADSSQVAAQVVSGIGMAAGAGLYIVAVGTPLEHSDEG